MRNIRCILYCFLTIAFFSCNSRQENRFAKSSLSKFEIAQSESLLAAVVQKEESNTDVLGIEKPSPNHSVLSWNIKDFGQSKDADEITQIASVVRDFDVVLIQEVVAKHPGGAQAVARLADQLNRMGAKWDYRISDPTQSPSAYISERYAFLWKTSKVRLKSKPSLDKSLESLVYREPYIATFIFKGNSLPVTIINYHSKKHNDHPEDEIQHFIDYSKRFDTSDILLCGDFNLNERHAVWDAFYSSGYTNALANRPTTLKVRCKNGNYLNHAIDNMYTKGEIKIVEAGVVDFVKACEHLDAARTISDHLPVYIKF